jgi:hypothetical protein
MLCTKHFCHLNLIACLYKTASQLNGQASTCLHDALWQTSVSILCKRKGTVYRGDMRLFFIPGCVQSQRGYFVSCQLGQGHHAYDNALLVRSLQLIQE